MNGPVPLSVQFPERLPTAWPCAHTEVWSGCHSRGSSDSAVRSVDVAVWGVEGQGMLSRKISSVKDGFVSHDF